MTSQTMPPKQKIDNAVDRLTDFMNKDLEQAKNFSKTLQPKTAELSKLEKLKKFIGHIASIELSEIEADENVRQQMDVESGEFKNLLESISRNGVQQNLIIEFIEDDSEKGFKLKCVAGHRRLAAAKIAELKSVPCLIRTFKDESEKLEIALAENLLREGLHVLDVADGYQRLLHLGWNKEDIQKYFDRNQKTTRYYLKIAQWSKEAKDLIRNNPDKLSGRLIMRKYACRKFLTNEDLINVLKSELTPPDTTKIADKRISLSSKVQSYLETTRYSNETKDIIWKLLFDLQLVKAVPLKD